MAEPGRVGDDTLADLIDEADVRARDAEEQLKSGRYGFDGGEELRHEDMAELVIARGIASALRELREFRGA